MSRDHIEMMYSFKVICINPKTNNLKRKEKWKKNKEI